MPVKVKSLDKQMASPQICVDEQGLSDYSHSKAGELPMLRNFMGLTVCLSVLFWGPLHSRLAAQEPTLTLNEILHRADSITTLNDSLLAKTNYKVKVSAYFNEIDSDGTIKNADTTIAVVTMKGNEEQSRELIYSTRKPEGKKEESKEEIILSLSPDNPDYNFSLTETTDSSYIIAVLPRTNPPKKGDVRGTIVVDRRNFFTRRIDFEVPRPEGALKEFATNMTFEPMEGGLVVMKEMSMKGYAKALLGIIRVRFTGSVRYSEYELLKYQITVHDGTPK